MEDDKLLAQLFQTFQFKENDIVMPTIHEQNEVDILINRNGLYDELLFLLKQFSFHTELPSYFN